MLGYSLKVWFATMVLAPLLFLLWEAFSNSLNYGIAQVYLGLVFYCALFSVPVLLFSLATFYLVRKIIKPGIVQNLSFFIISTGYMLLTFYLLFSDAEVYFTTELSALVVSVGFCLLLFSFAFRVKESE